MSKPFALDLFCKAGVSGRGLAQAGCEVLGIDIEPQPNYPFEFIQADALQVLRELVRFGCTTVGGRTLRLEEIDFIWASPPCQGFSAMQAANKGRVKHKKKHKDLLTPTHKLLKKLDKEWDIPWCIENVEGAPMPGSFMLSGYHFNLGVNVDGQRYYLKRNRRFLTNFPCRPPKVKQLKPVIGIYGGHVRIRSAKYGGRKSTEFEGQDKKALALAAMGLNSTTTITMEELSNGVPPMYSYWIISQVGN